MILQVKEGKTKKEKPKIIHKRGYGEWAKCGIELYQHDYVAHNAWAKVTCKNCLRSRPKKRT